MTMPLTEAELNHLVDFIGYGRLDADVWFLGMEEAGGGEENIRARLGFRPVMDSAEAHKMLGVTYLHRGKRKIQRTWRGMCYVMLRLEGREPTRENIREYQADSLGRYGGRTLLAELMPIPKPGVREWGYEELIPQITSREEYYEVVKPKRIRLLQGLVEEHRPKAIVAYGKGFWGDYRELFAGAEFKRDGRFMHGSHGETFVLLTGHFAARSMNGRFDEVVDVLRRESSLGPDSGRQLH